MKFAIFISLIVALMPTVHAADKKKAAELTVTYQTMPNSNSRDYSKPAFVTQDGVTYQTMPGSTTRDYSAPTWVTKHEETYQTMPGSTTRDYSKPAFRTEKK